MQKERKPQLIQAADSHTYLHHFSRTEPPFEREKKGITVATMQRRRRKSSKSKHGKGKKT